MGRREIVVVCPSCGFQSMVPPAAVMRNAYFCSQCGKAMDLHQQMLRPPGDLPAGSPAPRRDRGTSRYKSARKGRR